MGLQTFSLAHPAMARSKAALTEPETNAHRVFLPIDGAQLREKRHSSNYLKQQLEESVVYAAKGVLGIMTEHARKETGRHLEDWR